MARQDKSIDPLQTVREYVKNREDEEGGRHRSWDSGPYCQSCIEISLEEARAILAVLEKAKQDETESGVGDV